MREINQEQAIVIRKTILQQFHDFCVKNDLQYALGYGTLLGAIRHGGMIPWDDDIDLVMPREDYERLCTLFPDRDCKERYQFISHHNHPEVKTKIGYFIDYTTMTETAGRKVDYHGIHVDVAPMDIVPNGKWQRNWLFLKMKVARFIIKMKDLHPEIMQGRQKLIRQVLQVVFAPFDAENAYKRLHKYAKEYMHLPEEDRKTVCCLVEPGRPVMFPYEVTKKYTAYTYEGREYLSYEDYDTPLKAWYGDYMTPPPADQQKRWPHKWVHYYLKDDSDEEAI